MNIDAPIPGQSLTTQPKNAPWERPPEISDPKKALRMHMNRLSNPEMMVYIVAALDKGITVKELTTGVIRGAVSQGIHTIDVGMLIAPAIHEAIKTIGIKGKSKFSEGISDTSNTVKALNSISESRAVDEDYPVEEESPEEDMSEDGEEVGFMERRS